MIDCFLEKDSDQNCDTFSCEFHDVSFPIASLYRTSVSFHADHTAWGSKADRRPKLKFYILYQRIKAVPTLNHRHYNLQIIIFYSSALQ